MELKQNDIFQYGSSDEETIPPLPKLCCVSDDKNALQHRIEVLKRMSADDLLSKVTSLQDIICDVNNGKVASYMGTL